MVGKFFVKGGEDGSGRLTGWESDFMIPTPMANLPSHPNDPLHGVTLERVLQEMVGKHGWEGLALQIPIRCFMFDPSIRSSLTFLRKNPWARKKLEDWYGYEVTRRAL